MDIDLFTFGAQIINFIILLVLLRIFLYKPVINAMNEREEKIASRLRQAEEKQQEAEEESQRYQEKLSAIDEEREQLLAEARDHAAERRQELLQSAREEVDERKRQWQQAIQDEKERFLHNLQLRAEETVLASMRQALHELANAELEDQMIGVFTRRIRDHSGEVEDALTQQEDAMTVFSTFDLSREQREQIRGALGDERDVQFERDEELLCGIALHVGEYRLGWNLRQYLEALERNLRQTLDESIQEDEETLEPA